MGRNFFIVGGGLTMLGLVVALVRAQDSSAPPRSLADQLRASGQSINNEYGQPSAASPVANANVDATNLGATRSVLKRPDAKQPASVPPISPTIPAQPSQLQSSRRQQTTPRADAVQTSASDNDVTSPRVASNPIAGSQPSSSQPNSTTTSVEGRRLSSRRTQPTVIEKTSVVTDLKPPRTMNTPTDSAPANSSPSDTTSSRRAVKEITGAASPATTSHGVLTSSVGPLLRVDTVGPNAITIGEDATYVVTLENRGEAEATDVVVRVAIPDSIEIVSTQAKTGSPQLQQGVDGIRRLVWNVANVPGRDESKLTINVVPRASRPFDLVVDWSFQPMSASARVEVQQPQLNVVLSGPKEILYGETRVFSVTLTNPGTGAAKNVAVNLALGDSGAETMQVGTIPAGEKRAFDIEVTARQIGSLQVLANATGDGGLRAQANEQIRVRRAALELTAAGPNVQFAGSVGAYQVRLINSGDAVAHEVQAAIRLPQGLRYLKGIAGAKQISDALAWQVGDLAPGAQRVYQFHCELVSAGESRLVMGARSTDGVETSAEVVTMVEALADLKLTVNDPKGPLPVGDLADYEIVITNRGSKACGEVKVLAQFSDGIEAVEVEGGRAELLPGRVIFHPISRIVPGETVKLKVRAKAEAAGNHLFRAEVKCSDPETRLAAEDTTKYYGTKSFDTPALVPQAAGSTTPASLAPTPTADVKPSSNDSIYGGQFGSQP